MERLRVLFVDDEEELVSAVVERLELRGVEAVGATTGAEALRLIAARPFDVVVLDVKMPGLGGFEVIRRVKTDHPELQVVLLSGHGSAENVEEGMRLGAFDYLQKPIDIDVLLGIVRDASRRT
jgi:two-component system, OmpR family, response regulator